MVKKNQSTKHEKLVDTRAAFYVYTTLSNGTEFVDWGFDASGQIPVRKYSVTINGGAGVANANRKRGLITPLGMMTEITQDQMDFLNTNKNFLMMKADGWMTVVKAGGWRDDADDIAADMAQRDGCTPNLPEDFEQAKAGELASLPKHIADRHKLGPMIHRDAFNRHFK